MASIRRTLSPVNQERSSLHQNGLNPSPLSINSTSQKLSHHTFWGTKKGLHKSLKRPFYRCLVFFFVGFLLGILPFGHNEKPRHLSFDNIGGGFGGGGGLQEFVHIHEEKLRVLNDDKYSSLEYDVSEVNVGLSSVKFDYKPRKLLIVVTPTSDRALQSYYLHRLGQVLKLVNPPVLWVVVEMGGQMSETAAILRDTGVMYRHLVCRKNVTDVKDRIVHQRNTALDHIDLHRLDGVVYFADDDNVYSLELFERIRYISHFGTWPVAMLAPSKNKALLEGPVCNGSQVIGWHTNEKIKTLRRFYAHMSGFAFNSTILWVPKRWKRPFLNPIRQLDTVKEGFQETSFIEQFIEEESQMSGIPNGCEKIMNWHLHLDAHGAAYPKGWLLQRNLDAVLPTN